MFNIYIYIYIYNNVLYRGVRSKIVKKKFYLFVELLFINSKLKYNIYVFIFFYILQKNLTLALFYTFVESFLVFRVISQLYKSKNLKDFNELFIRRIAFYKV